MRTPLNFSFLVAAVAATVLVAGDAAAQKKRTPYFASISAGQARMRTGPGREYPASWLYQRADLPVRVLEIYKEWRKVEDPGGTQGWMLGNLLSATRTGYVSGTIAELRDTPRAAGRVVWRAEPGVVGRISKCADGWCWFDVHGQAGYIEANRIWGAEPGETLP